MSVTINTQAMKTRETVNGQWSNVMIKTDAEVNAVVQDTEPTGNENVWFDTSNESEVVVPTMNDLNEVKDSITEIIDISSQFTINKTSGSGTISAFYNPASGVVRLSGNFYSPQTVAYNYSFCSVASAYRPSEHRSIPAYVIMSDNTPAAFAVTVRKTDEGIMMLSGQWKYVYFSGVYKL